MKFIAFLFFVLAASVATQAGTVMRCQISEDDITSVVINEQNGQFTLTEITKRGEPTTTIISSDVVENQHYRLSDGRYGFRYLSLMYSDIFNEFDWFVESRGGFAYTISRAYCE